MIKHEDKNRTVKVGALTESSGVTSVAHIAGCCGQDSATCNAAPRSHARARESAT